MTADSEYTVIVPARSGSTRLPNKNIAPLPFTHGLTVLEWRLEQLKQVFPASAIVVSSDSEHYLTLARAAGVRTHRRSDELSSSTVPFADVVDALARTVDTPYFGWAPPTSPLFGPRHMRQMVEMFEGMTPDEKESGLGVAEELGGYFAYGGTWLNFLPGRTHRNSQDLEYPVRITWGLSLRATTGVLRTSALFDDPRPVFFIPSWAAVDIDDADDFETAKLLWPFYQRYEKGIGAVDVSVHDTAVSS